LFSLNFVPTKVIKNPSRLVEFLDQGKLRPGLIVREQGERLALLQPDGREKLIHRDLVLLRHSDRAAVEPATLAAAVAELEQERTRLSAELDLKLLWEVVREQGRGFSAEELAELFFGRRAPIATSVVLEALLNDRLYFTRRHLEFSAESAERVERLRVQHERLRLKSESSRKTLSLLRAALSQEAITAEEAKPLAVQLCAYLENPHTRSSELTAQLTQTAPDLNPAEAAYEILERLGQAPAQPRFAAVGALPSGFAETVLNEAQTVNAPQYPAANRMLAVSIDDEETVEIDDALSCEPMTDGGLRVLIHIALVAALVPKGGAMDREAASRATTVYLPETTVRMLPDAVSCDKASLIAGLPRAVLTTEVHLGADASVLDFRIYPSMNVVSSRLTYHQADQLLANAPAGEQTATMLRALAAMGNLLRERRRRAGALLIARRESKIRVRGEKIELEVIDTAAPSRLMVAEYMVLANHLAARFAAENQLELIYRTQPSMGSELANQHPRLSLFPAFHAGIGLPCYAQVSSPIRRYADLVLQRQVLGALEGRPSPVYRSEELLAVLASAESADAEAKELERRAKRYWSLRWLAELPQHGPLTALVWREGASAELADSAIRGTLRGAPNLPNQAKILVRPVTIDPLRGWLALEYAGPAPA